MRILMFSKACIVGTYQTKLEALAREPDVELAVVVPPRWGEQPLERVHTDGYKLWVEPLRFNGRFHYHFYPTLPQRIADFQPDILHMDEEPYNLATWLAWRAARRAGVKTLFFTWQNLLRHYPPPFRWLEQQVLQGVDFALMGNQAAVEVFRRKGYEGPYRVIPQFGVSPTLFRPSEVARPEAAPFAIGFAGRLVAEKGLDLLLRAAAELDGAWQVRLVGSGPEERPLRQLATRLGIADRITFEGGRPSSDMPAFLQQLDVLVLPSRSRPNWQEQFGRVLIEAMACGIPVIGSASGEIPHVIGPGGLIFPEEEVPALRAHLRSLQHNPQLRRTLATTGRQRVLDHYTQARIAQETAAVYRHMLTG